MLADAYYPGWSATVDGVEQPIYPVNLALRGVALSPGRHRIEFRYAQAPLRQGLRLSGLGGCAARLGILATATATQAAGRRVATRPPTRPGRCSRGCMRCIAVEDLAKLAQPRFAQVVEHRSQDSWRARHRHRCGNGPAQTGRRKPQTVP